MCLVLASAILFGFGGIGTGENMGISIYLTDEILYT